MSKSAKGRRARARGAEYEREISEVFKALGFDKARRNLQPQGGRVVGNDLTGVPFAIECKRTDVPIAPKAIRALEQCDADAKAIDCDDPRLVITRANSGESYVFMTLEDFAKLVFGH